MNIHKEFKFMNLKYKFKNFISFMYLIGFMRNKIKSNKSLVIDHGIFQCLFSCFIFSFKKQINYEDISKKRFSNIDKTVYASGYRSFFDITPDLRFILGKDSKYTNLFHNLGSGQAMKYSPVLGESVAEEIMNESLVTKKFDYKKFNINRFGDDYMKEFWNLVQGEENTLHRQGKNSL